MIKKWMLWLLCYSLPVTAAPGIDPVELEAFIDGVVNTSMRQNHIAGVTIAITQDDQLLLLKGYGYQDVDAQLPVDPETTLFRIGSVSKLFTWTGLMQLREQGKLNLDTDINEYLTLLKVPETFGEPITLRHLMTHSGGIEDRVVKLFGDDASDMQPYADILAQQLPARVRAPGEVSSYSNHGVGLAGLVLEEVSGMAWADYVQTHILAPLQMQAATAEQPIPESLAGSMSRGYVYEAGKYRTRPFEFVPLAAAGGMSASALAMSRFARAHLGDGSVDGRRILSKESVMEMREPLFQEHQEIKPWLHGFANYSRGDTFIYGHSGGTLRFFTEFALIPEHQISVFVSTNTTMGHRVMGAVLRGFLDRYLPDSLTPIPATTISDLEKITGNWATYRHPVTTPDKLLRITQPVNVQLVAEDELMVAGLGEQPSYWRQVEPLVFQRVDENVRMVFKPDESPPRMIVGTVLNSYYRIGWMESTSGQTLFLSIGLMLSLWVLIAWPVQQVRRDGTLIRLHSRARWGAWLQSVVVIAFVVLSLTISEDVVFGLGTGLQLMLWLSYGVPLMVLVQLVTTAGLFQSRIGWGVKVFHSLMILVGLYLSWWFYYWNLYGPYAW